MDIDYYILTRRPVKYQDETYVATSSYDDGTVTIMNNDECKDVFVSELEDDHEK